MGDLRGRTIWHGSVQAPAPSHDGNTTRAVEAVVLIESYLYWIAMGDRAFGEGDKERVELLRELWRNHRVVDAVSAFDGASFWLADGQPHARVIRAVHTGAVHPVQVVDVDPAPVIAKRP